MPEMIFPNIGGNALAAFGMGRDMRARDDATQRLNQGNLLAGQAFTPAAISATPPCNSSRRWTPTAPSK